MKSLKAAQFYHREYDGPKRKPFVFFCLGTLTYVLVVAIVNEAAMVANSHTDIEVRLFAMYIITCAICLLCKRAAMMNMTIMAETVVRTVRVRLSDKLRQTDLEFLESIDKEAVYARLAQDTDLISVVARDVLYALETIFICLFVCIYIAFVSTTGLILTGLFMTFLSGYVYFSYSGIKKKLNSARIQEQSFFNALDDLLSGFKEIKINRDKGEDLFNDIKQLSAKSKTLKIKAGKANNGNIVLGFTSYAILLGIFIFLVPPFSGAKIDSLLKLIAALLFILSLLLTLSRGLQAIVSTNLAVENIEKLEARLDSYKGYSQTSGKGFKSFSKISLKSIRYTYRGKYNDTPFTLGPLDLTIQKGDALFIIGGNGSGKSTLLKLLTGLYYPAAKGGSLELNGKPLAMENYQAYRELFSIIFTDFHLFKKLYGLDNVDQEEVRELLVKMDIRRKTDYIDGKVYKY